MTFPRVSIAALTVDDGVYNGTGVSLWRPRLTLAAVTLHRTVSTPTTGFRRNNLLKWRSLSAFLCFVFVAFVLQNSTLSLLGDGVGLKHIDSDKVILNIWKLGRYTLTFGSDCPGYGDLIWLSKCLKSLTHTCFVPPGEWDWCLVTESRSFSIFEKWITVHYTCLTASRYNDLVWLSKFSLWLVHPVQWGWG